MTARRHLSRAAAAAGVLIALVASPPADAQDLARSSRGTGRIVGGVKAEPGDFKFPVSIQRKTTNGFEHSCGGTLIKPVIDPAGDGISGWSNEAKDSRWVLTAAHCVTDETGLAVPPSELQVVSGTVDLEQAGATCAGAGPKHPGIVQAVELVFTHDDYLPETNGYDFALLRLPALATACLNYMNRRPIKLPDSSDAQWINQPYTALTITGWGRRSEGGYAGKDLMKVMVPLVDTGTCATTYGNLGVRIWPEMLCAGYQTGGFDACQGDSGGPLFFTPVNTLGQPVKQPVLVGVVSWGEGCARGAGLFGIYARVIHARGWIERTVLANQ